MEEVWWMKIIFKRQLITPGNYPRMAGRIVPQDQRDAIRPGIRISHYSFTNRQGQQGYVIVCHTTRRAGICFAGEQTQWGRWQQETDVITTDDGRKFTRMGDEIYDAVGQDSAQEAIAR
jgi:hypothetical protein